MYQSPSNSRNQECILDLQFQGVVDRLLGFLEHRVELGGLRDGTGEAVENETGALVGCTRLEGTHDPFCSTAPPGQVLELQRGLILLGSAHSSTLR